jgi:hypothetical protein
MASGNQGEIKMRRDEGASHSMGGDEGRGRLAALAVCGVLATTAIAGCGGEFSADDSVDEAPNDVTTEPSVETVSSALKTITTSGHLYAKDCASNKVPLPPDWGASTIYPKGPWIDNGSMGGDSFVGLHGEIFYWETTIKDGTNKDGSAHYDKGICVINAHLGSFFDVICQNNDTGKACFWEGSTDLITGTDGGATPPTVAVNLGSTTVDSTAVVGGTDLNTHDHCTRCHTGENAFVGHYMDPLSGLSHALNLRDKWMTGRTDPTTNPPTVTSAYLNPVAPASFPDRGAETTDIAPSCKGCHVEGGLAGRFPKLAQSQIRGYCGILSKVTSIPGDSAGMPPGVWCGEGDDSNPCTQKTDWEVLRMVSDCGAPFPQAPTSISNLGTSKGIGNEFLAFRRHGSGSAAGYHEHRFINATETMPAAGCCRNQNAHPALVSGDKIQVSVYLPSDDKTQEVMLRVNNGTKWYQVFWGTDLITSVGTRKNMGALPGWDGWKTLTFTPADLGMTGTNVLKGMAFALYDGTASWADVLFRSSDSPYSGTYVSQMWVGDKLPAGATTEVVNGDSWSWSFQNNLVRLNDHSSYQSSTYSGGSELGVDGNTDGNWSHGSVFHTSSGYNSNGMVTGANGASLNGGEFWFVDLHGLRNVRRVVLYNRTDCCQDRLSHFRINYWDPIQNIWRMASDQSSFVASTTNPVMGFNVRNPDISSSTDPSYNVINTGFIMIQKTDSNYLHLAEVEIYGDAPVQQSDIQH